MKAAYQPRTCTIGRVDQGAELTIINDTQQIWKDSIKVTLIHAVGELVGNHDFKIELQPFEVQRLKLTEVFPVIADGNYEGFLHAQGDTVQAARRTNLKPATAAPKQDLNISHELHSGKLIFKVSANKYVHELSVLPELFGLGVNSDHQLVSLLPGQSSTFEIVGENEVLIKVVAGIDRLFWSHNRLVNP